MNNIPEKARNICELYHDGQSLTAISKQYNCQVHNIVEYLDRWYSRIYDTKWARLRDLRLNKAKEIKKKFTEIYKPFKYTRADICRMLKCTPSELEFTLKQYNMTHLRLQTYGKQKTLCNIPEENFEEYKAYANAHHISIRALACRAINEYILFNQKD